MTTTSVNGVGVSGGRIIFPLVGTWFAELTVAGGTDPIALTGPVTLEVGSTVLVGTGKADADEGNLVTVEIVGGAGGLGNVVEPKHYVAATRRTVLADLLQASGELLSPVVDPSLLDEPLTSWMRAAGAVSDALKRLVAPTKASWRVLLDGSLWIGQELWPPVEPEHTLEKERPTQEELLIAVEGVLVVPGTTFLGKRVSSVEYEVSDRALRAIVRYGALRGGLAAEFGQLIARETAGQVFQAIYRTIVLGQNADDSLELASSDPRIGNMSRVPIRPGIAGVDSLRVAPKTVALVEFENGDESKPVATGFAMGSATRAVLDLELLVGGDSAIAVALDDLVRQRLAELVGPLINTPAVPQDGGATIQAAVKGALLAAGWSAAGMPPSMGSDRLKGTPAPPI